MMLQRLCNRSGSLLCAYLALVVCLCSVAQPITAWSMENSGAESKPLFILAGTSTAADILHDLCGPDDEIRLLIPGGACPGHYDLRPGDLRFLGKADLLVLEAFQPAMPNMLDLTRAAENSSLVTFVLPKAESAMLPEAQRRLTQALAECLAKLRPESASVVAQATAKRLERINAVEARETARLQQAGVAGTPVLCSSLQTSFAKWIGLKVVGTYGRPEDLTPERFEKIHDLGKDNNVRLVLDNIQSGPGAGRGLAESLGAGQTNLTSFPGAWEVKDSDDDGWASAFSGNVSRVLSTFASSGS